MEKARCRVERREMETDIQSLEINFTDGVLRINGADVKDRPVVVCVPGPDGWTNRKLFNPNLVSGGEETLDKLEVSYTAAANSKPL
jgi:hypothetical protein